MDTSEARWLELKAQDSRLKHLLFMTWLDLLALKSVIRAKVALLVRAAMVNSGCGIPAF